MTSGPLTTNNLNDFHVRGWVKLRAFSTEDAVAMEQVLWQRLEKYGVLREDRSTWVNILAGGLSQRARQHRLFREAITAEFRQAVDQLLGEGWRRPKDWGSLLFSFPEVDPRPWDVATSMFHWHMDPLQNIDRVRSLICFSFLSQVLPEGGGTLLVEGSHHVVSKYFAELTPELHAQKSKVKRLRFYQYHPWLKELTTGKDLDNRSDRFMADPTDVFGYPLRVVELTGEPGEVFITNASAVHATSRNCADRPRFMRVLGLHRDPDLADGALTNKSLRETT